MRNKTFLLIVSAICFFSCNKQEFDGKNGLKVVHFPNSEDTCQTIEYKNGLRNGNLKEYFENGNLKTVQHFKDDKNVDTAMFYHANGNIAAIQIYNKGERVGCWRKYNEKGGLYSEVNFKNNYFDGPATEYHYKSLHLKDKFSFKMGLKDGLQETYHLNGKIKSQCYYYQNQPGLCTKEWSDDEQLVDNDFKISVSESNKVNLENKLYYFVSLSNSASEDEVWQVLAKDTGCTITRYQKLEKMGNQHRLQFSIYKGGFIMEKVKIVAFRKTKFGNMYAKPYQFTASANHY